MSTPSRGEAVLRLVAATQPRSGRARGRSAAVSRAERDQPQRRRREGRARTCRGRREASPCCGWSLRHSRAPGQNHTRARHGFLKLVPVSANQQTQDMSQAEKTFPAHATHPSLGGAEVADTLSAGDFALQFAAQNGGVEQRCNENRLRAAGAAAAADDHGQCVPRSAGPVVQPMNVRSRRLSQRGAISCGVVFRRDAQSSKFKAQGKVQGASPNAEPIDRGLRRRANVRGRSDKTWRWPTSHRAWSLNLPLSFELYPWSFFTRCPFPPNDDNPLFS